MQAARAARTARPRPSPRRPSGHGADRPFDQRSAVVERDDPNAARQAGLQLADLRLDPARDLERVLAVGHEDHARRSPRCRLSPGRPGENPAQLRYRRLRPSRTVPPPGSGDDHVLQVAQAQARIEGLVAGLCSKHPIAHASHHVFGVALVDHVPSRCCVGRRDGVDDIVDRQTRKARSRCGIGRDLVLDGKPADARDLRNAGNRAELRADVPVLNRAEPAQIESTSLDGVPEDLPGRRRVGRQLRRGAGGQALLEAASVDRRPAGGLRLG